MILTYIIENYKVAESRRTRKNKLLEKIIIEKISLKNYYSIVNLKSFLPFIICSEKNFDLVAIKASNFVLIRIPLLSHIISLMSLFV